MGIKLLSVSVALTCLLAAAPPAVTAADGDGDVLQNALQRADLLVRGVVRGIDDQRAVDGGHVYTIDVTASAKGAPGERLQVRAGGFFYTVELEEGDEIAAYLRRYDNSSVYGLVHAPRLRPMIFRVEGEQVLPVDGRIDATTLDQLFGNNR
ncbi:MAG: hypothetical protein AAF515_08855 [Pseudomonadota bacterium]